MVVRLIPEFASSTERTRLMAQTGKGQKFNRIAGYTRADGTKVKGHVRSNPTTSAGPKRAAAKKKK